MGKKHGIRKSVISMTTAAALIFTGITVPQPESYAKAAKALTQIKITNVKGGSLELNKGASYQVKAKAGKKTNASFTWKSSNSKVVSVSKKGKIKGLKNGKVTITVSGKKFKKATLKVTVNTKVTTVRVIQPVAVVMAGRKKTLRPQVLPEDASNKKLKFTSADESIVSVDSDGVIQGKKEGNTEVTIEATDGSKKKTTVTVKVADSEADVQAADDFYESVNADIFASADYDEAVGNGAAGMIHRIR